MSEDKAIPDPKYGSWIEVKLQDEKTTIWREDNSAFPTIKFLKAQLDEANRLKDLRDGEGWSLVDENGSDADIGEADFKLVSYSAVQELLDALEYYADPKKWSECVSSGGIFTEADGDQVECFDGLDNQGPDQGYTARAALTKFREGKVKV